MYVVNEQHKSRNGKWYEYSDNVSWCDTPEEAENEAAHRLKNGAEKVTIFETRLVYEHYKDQDKPLIYAI